MPPPLLRLLLLLVLALTGCAGSSEQEACVEHSVEEGIDRAVAERACAQVGDDE